MTSIVHYRTPCGLRAASGTQLRMLSGALGFGRSQQSPGKGEPVMS
ncbi:hypothetical protein ABZ896_22850 [Streptomyces sp. NPDC047072]